MVRRMIRTGRKEMAIQEGLRLRELRKSLRLTPKELAEKLDTNVKYIYMMEGGKRGIGPDMLGRIVKALGVGEEVIVRKDDHYQDADDPVLAETIKTVREAKDWPREKKLEFLLEIERLAARLRAADGERK